MSSEELEIWDRPAIPRERECVGLNKLERYVVKSYSSRVNDYEILEWA